MSLATSIEQIILTKIVDKNGEEVLKSLDRSASLIGLGLLDSLDFISMLMEIESSFELDIDFEDADPVQFTSVNGLMNLLCESDNV